MKYRIKGETKLHPTGLAAAMHHFCSAACVVLTPGAAETTWMDMVSGRTVTVERVETELAPYQKHFIKQVERGGRATLA